MRHWQRGLFWTAGLAVFVAALIFTPHGANAATLTGYLHYGDQSSQVAVLQSDLDLLGYPVKTYTGYFGPVTLARVKAFQADRGLAVDGIVGSPTRSAILSALNDHFHMIAGAYGAIELTVGDVGSAVETLQGRLAALGYDVGPVNGVVMGKTADAILAFQKKAGLEVTQVVDAATFAAIDRALGRPGTGSNGTGAGSGGPSRSGNTVTAPDGRVLAYRGVFNMVATAYDATPQSNGKWGPYAAWDGSRLRPGYIAVDPRVIPLGTKVYVTGYRHPALPAGGFVGIAADTGGAIKGNRVDIYIEASTSSVMNFGFQNVKVYVLQ
ncbi:MAG TPA: peptidoglycan-binding protein [Bacillota bacterium]